MHGFGFKRTPVKTSRWSRPEHILWLFLGAVFFFLLVGGVRSRGLVGAVKNGDIDALAKEKNRLGVAGAGFDPQLGHAVHQVLQLVDIYTTNDRDVTADERMKQVLRFLRNNGQDWKETVPETYQGLFDLMIGVSEFEDDIISLLGFQSPQTYLVLLQNTAESRPNGGFFGSFAVVKVAQGKILDVEIRDSYILDYEQNGVKIEGPERFLQYLPHRDVHFVGANKSGFTYIDGDNIKKLYEKVYPGEVIRGVVFLRTDMFEQLIPGFTQQQREWQFTNAATDLIRGTDGFGKKELYVNQVTDILAEHKATLLRSMIETLPDLIEQGYINIYPHKVSVSGGRYGGGLEGWLRENTLTTRFESELIYSREANTSYNKIDSFVHKKIDVFDASGSVYYAGTSDRIDLSGLPSGDRTIRITYELAIPADYRQAIAGFEREYGIQLTDRERHILAITPTWEARGLLYLGKQYEIRSVTGDITSGWDFSTPIPTNTAGYMVEILQDGGKAIVDIAIRK